MPDTKAQDQVHEEAKQRALDPGQRAVEAAATARQLSPHVSHTLPYHQAKRAFQAAATRATEKAAQLGLPLARAGGAAAGKAARFATSGTSPEMIGELAYGVPATFLEEYSESLLPYNKVKYVSEHNGPLSTLEQASLDELSYDDAVRLANEGYLQAPALDQVREHYRATRGFDPAVTRHYREKGSMVSGDAYSRKKDEMRLRNEEAALAPLRPPAAAPVVEDNLVRDIYLTNPENDPSYPEGRIDMYGEGDGGGVVFLPPTTPNLLQEGELGRDFTVTTTEDLKAQKSRVREMQQTLADQGFYSGVPDGVYNDKTVKAIRAAQAAGVVVPRTQP